MLQTTDLSIVEISSEVGFNTHESFTRSFKEHFNYTPKNFRKENPKVILNEKPLLTEGLIEHITKGMTNEPIIVDNPVQTRVGNRVEIPTPITSDKYVCEFVIPYWFDLLEKEIKNRKTDTYYGIIISSSCDFTEERLDYMAGVPVFSLDIFPKGMNSYTLPKQKVAMFEIKAELDSERFKKNYRLYLWVLSSQLFL